MFSPSFLRPFLPQQKDPVPWFYGACVAVIAVFCLVYAAVRAFTISVFFDEVSNFFFAVERSYWEILTYHNITSASHLLNTLLMKFCIQLFGPSEGVLRLPALIGLGIYLAGVYKVLGIFTRKAVLVGGYALLTLQPMILELGSAARGYGLGLGFFSFGIYYLLKAVTALEDETWSRCRDKALWLMALATLAQMVFVYLFVGLNLVFLYSDFERWLKTPKDIRVALLPWVSGRIWSYLWPCLVLAVIYVNPVIQWHKDSSFHMWYGGTTGFWFDTIGSCITATLYDLRYQTFVNFIFIENLIRVLLAAAAGIVLWAYFTRRTLDLYERSLAALLALSGSLWGISFMTRHLFGTKYLLGRYAIYIIPLILLVVVILWVRSQQGKSRLLAGMAGVFFWLVCLLSVANFFRAGNLSHYQVCRYAANIKSMMAAIELREGGKNRPDNSVTVGIYWLFEPGVKYYRTVKKMNWLKPVDYDVSEEKADYYIFCLDPFEVEKWGLEEVNRRVMSRHRLKVVGVYRPVTSILATSRE